MKVAHSFATPANYVFLFSSKEFVLSARLTDLNSSVILNTKYFCNLIFVAFLANYKVQCPNETEA